MKKLFYCLLFLSCNVLAQEWKHIGLETESITTIAIDWSDSNILYAGSGSNFSAGTVGGMFKTTNGGVTWDTLIRGVTVREIVMHPINSDIIYATLGLNVLTTAGIIKSTDKGIHWMKADYGIRMSWEEGPGPIVIDPKHPDTVYTGTAGAMGGHFYKSTNGGINWYSFGDTTYLTSGVIAIAVNPENTNIMYASTAGGCNVLRSTDGGIVWHPTGFTEFIRTMEFSRISSRLYLGGWFTDSWPVVLFRSSANDSTFENLKDGLPDTLSIFKIQMRETSLNEEVFILGIGSDNGGVFRSVNGNHWEKIGTNNGGMFRTIAVCGSKLYAGGEEGGVCVMDIPSSVPKDTPPLPRKFYLYDNFPNPFNPGTNVTYEIATRDNVSLEVFDIQGREIKTLVRKEQFPGKYSVYWNGQNEKGSIVSSGVYLCVLRVGGIELSKKMVYLK